ncbi:DUF1858 domain-containing protein [archaeon]|nr:DUF1858 domain-containing protein [archaeon]
MKIKPCKRKKSNSLIKKDAKIGEIIRKYPKAFDIFIKHGLHCVGCAVASLETIEEGANAHGIGVKKLLKELNKTIKK